MATLHVRNISNELYAQLQELALAENRSLSAEIAQLLDQAVKEEHQRLARKPLLTKIRRRRFQPPVPAPGSLVLLREDRDR